MKIVWNNYELTNLRNEVISNLKKLGYEPAGYVDKNIKINGRYKRAVAKCGYKYINGKRYFTIEFAKFACMKGTNEAIISTMYHEIIHTLPECFNHGPNFKKVANEVFMNYGVNVEVEMTEKRLFGVA